MIRIVDRTNRDEIATAKITEMVYENRDIPNREITVTFAGGLSKEQFTYRNADFHFHDSMLRFREKSGWAIDLAPCEIYTQHGHGKNALFLIVSDLTEQEFSTLEELRSEGDVILSISFLVDIKVYSHSTIVGDGYGEFRLRRRKPGDFFEISSVYGSLN